MINLYKHDLFVCNTSVHKRMLIAYKTLIDILFFIYLPIVLDYALLSLLIKFSLKKCQNYEIWL